MKRSEKKAATRDALMRTALTLFGRDGYEETTVARITEAAGVAKGTFFNYFATKEDVLLQVGESGLDWVAGQIGEIRSADGNGVRPLAPQVTGLLVGLATRMPYTPALIRSLLQSSLSTPERLSGNTAQFLALGRALEPLFALGQERGEFIRRPAAGELAALAVQAYLGALLWWSASPADQPLGRWMATSVDALFWGIEERTPCSTASP